MWRADELFGEARRNIGPAQVAFGVLATFVLAAVMGYCLVAAQQALTQEGDRREAGSLVWVAMPVDAGLPLDGARCTNLGNLPGVAAAGGVASQPAEPIYAYPGSTTPVPVTELTPGALQVFLPQAPTNAVTLGADLFALGSAAPGQWLFDSLDQPVLLPEVVVSDSPLGLLNGTVTTTTLADVPVNTCWVRMEPGSFDAGRDVLAYAFPGTEALVAPFLDDPEGVLTPAEQWRAAIGVRPWLIGTALLTASALLLAWTRRSEVAVYRTFGSDRIALTQMSAIELTLTLIPSLAAATIVTAVLAAVRWASVLAEVVGIALAQGAAATLASLALAAALSGTFARGDITQTLRDR